jgi:hypothetical protein
MAEHRRAGDGKQRPLVPRSRFWRRRWPCDIVALAGWTAQLQAAARQRLRAHGSPSHAATSTASAGG